MQDTTKRISDPEIAFQCCKEIANSINENVLTIASKNSPASKRSEVWG